jgi:hypothetical protein
MRDLMGRITRLEITVGAVIALVMVSVVLIEPNILEAPFENARTLLFTFGGTALAAVALVAMLRLDVPPVVRVIVLVVPFAIVNWWLISPYFIDETVDDEFSTSISQQLGAAAEVPTTTAVAPENGGEPATGATTATTEAPAATDPDSAPEEPSVSEAEPAPTPSGPVLLGSGQFVGLAGHEGTGDAGIFQNPDGSFVLRFENFDIENGPDLEVYLVPGADQTSLPEGSIHLGPLKGNVGDQNYDLPAGTELEAGAYTVLVWCEAFSVEFVGATIEV